MTEDEWGAGWVRCIGVEFSGKMLDHVDAIGQPIQDDTFLIMLNPHWEPIKFYMPGDQGERSWRLLVDTKSAEDPEAAVLEAGQTYELIPRSTAVFCEVEAAD
jgi:glycogen operon protein